MRTSVYTFLLLTCLLLTPCAFVEAGTDDSGLQVFTVDFSQQMGESDIAATEDSKISPYCYNLLPSGNGLMAPANNSVTSPFTATREKVFLDGQILNGNAVLLEYSPTTGTCEVNLTGATETKIMANVNSNAKDIFAFYQLGKAYFLAYDQFVELSRPSTLTSLTGKPWQSYGSNVFAIFKNRLWVGGRNAFSDTNTLFYSSASDMTDFTNAPGFGGTISLPQGAANILSIQPTSYGLYVFTAFDGIWLISGGDTPTSWRIDKISDVAITTGKAVFTHKNIVYFYILRTAKIELYALSGMDVQLIATLPYGIGYYSGGVTSGIIYDNYFVLALGYSVSCYIYNLKTGFGFQTTEINGFVGDKYIIQNSAPSTYKIRLLPYLNTYSGEPIISPWAYKTAWLTLDGNASNRKEIDRIEFDYQGGTTAVYLYYAWGNGATDYATTTLTAPVNTRLSTYVWNAPIGKQQSNRFYLYFLSNGVQTMTTPYILKQARIYYRNIGNYKTNSLR